MGPFLHTFTSFSARNRPYSTEVPSSLYKDGVRARSVISRSKRMYKNVYGLKTEVFVYMSSAELPCRQSESGYLCAV